MRLDITEELKEKFLEFFPNRGKALTLTYTFKDYGSQLEKDFAAYLDGKGVDYISYLNIKWDFKGSFFIFHRKAHRQIFTYIPHFYIPSKDLVIDIYQKERAKNKYKIATFLFGNLNERYNKNHLYLSKEVFELIKLNKLDQLDNNRRKEIEWKLLAETNIFNPEAYLQEGSFNDYKFKLKEEKKLSKIKKIKKIKIIEPDFTNLVYVIKCHDKYKIGQTISLKKRMRSLSAIIPENLELVIKIEDVDHRAFERFLHLKFRAQRLKGEWFNLSEDHLNYIKSEQCLEEFKNKKKG